MHEYNGFHINTDIKNKKSFKPCFKKLIRNPLIKGVAVILVVFALVMTFLSVVPLKKVTVIEKCVATDTNGNKEISYYNEDGNVEKAEYYNGDMKYSHKEYTYTKDKKVETVKSYYNDEPFDTETYTYTDGLLHEVKTEGVDGTAYSKTVYTYTDGILELSVSFDGEDKAVTEIQYKYDESRCIRKIATTISNGYVVTTDYTYNKGNLEKEEKTSGNGIKTSIRYTYDKYGNVLSKSSGVDDYTLYTYTYKTAKVPVL